MCDVFKRELVVCASVIPQVKGLVDRLCIACFNKINNKWVVDILRFTDIGTCQIVGNLVYYR